MNSPDLQRINALAQIETALRCLTSYGYETAPLWKEHHEWLQSTELREPTDDDRHWATRAGEPSSVADHFRDNLPEPLSAAQCWQGRQYTLTPGQRAYLRDRYGLTPTRVVELIEVGLFRSAPTVVHTFVLRSAEHVDEQRRRHVLNAVCITNAAEFFARAAQIDKQREDDATASATKESTPKMSKRMSMVEEYCS
jgi:hypothetical protein